MSNDKTTLLKRVLDHAVTRADQAEIYSLESGHVSVNFRNGVLRTMDESQDAGFCLRIIKDGRIAQVTTSNMDKAMDTVDQAMELVPFGQTVGFSFPRPADLPDLETPPSLSRDFDVLVDQSQVIINKIKAYDSSLMANAGSSAETINVTLMNSNGVDIRYQRHTQSVAAYAVLAEEGNILTTYRYDMGQVPCKNPESLADNVIHLMSIGRKNVPFTGGALPIVFTPLAMADIFAAFGSGINGSAVAKGMSPLTGRIGEQLMNEKITIEDHALYPMASGTQIIDDEGVPCRRNYLIQNGVLKNYLLDLNSASKLDMQPTGNGFRYTALIKSRSYAAAPSPAFTNLVLPAGENSCDDILKSAGRMLLIDQLTGVLLGNLINGDWSGNIEYGILYENGRPVGRIKNAMTGGNFYSMFKNAYVESSREREWVSGFGGGAGSSYFPYILFDGLNVSA
jgi:PmbA protein